MRDQIQFIWSVAWSGAFKKSSNDYNGQLMLEPLTWGLPALSQSELVLRCVLFPGQDGGLSQEDFPDILSSLDLPLGLNRH